MTNSPRSSTMAPPSGVEAPTSYPFSVEPEQDRWRPRVAAPTPTFPPAPSTSAGIDRGSINATFRDLRELFAEKLGSVMSEE
jgi:hypothetical protein